MNNILPYYERIDKVAAQMIKGPIADMRLVRSTIIYNNLFTCIIDFQIKEGSIP